VKIVGVTVSLAPGALAEFIGDSITDCGRRDDAPRGLGTGYVRLLADRLAERKVRVVNRGISGNRAVDLLARWRPDCLDLRPDLLTVYIGINDTWRRYDSGDATSAEAFEATYRQLLTSAAASLSAPLVLMEPFLLPVTDEQRSWREDLDPKIAAVGRLAKEFGATLVPLDSILTAAVTAEGPAALAHDGVHPTPTGHELIATAWLTATLG